MGRQPNLARRFFDRFEPVHAVTYFAPEARTAMDALGYRGFWMGYFAARSAPLGPVPAEVVTAVFYNFAPARVAKALPAAWEVAGPAEALRAREESAVVALRRYGLVDDDGLRTAAELAAKAAVAAPVDGRPLFAANLSLDWPTDPLARLWHAVTLLREHRGDAHVAVLAAAGISGRECNVLHAAAGKVPAEMIMRSRDYDEQQWAEHQSRLAGRGLLDDGGLTDAGRALKQHIEDTTDALALSALDGLTDDEVELLFQTLTPLARAVVAGGDLPQATPMGLNRNDLDDDSAGLRTS
ncbi:SCO6745 family protein [Mycobacterium sp. NPDC050041]|uniref:SCO6745 family protein n=1 Tax=Mycobacterium sp. NPDC050041 TaxID=3364293 RepID=UPI003C2BC119